MRETLESLTSEEFHLNRLSLKKEEEMVGSGGSKKKALAGVLAVRSGYDKVSIACPKGLSLNRELLHWLAVPRSRWIHMTR